MATGTVNQLDIARRVGVSRSHVAKVLSGNPRTTVSAEMRKRIMDAAREMGYAPNAAARMLRSGSTQNIVLAYVRPSELEFGAVSPTIVHAMAEKLGGRGYKLEVVYAQDNDSLMRLLRDCAQSRAADAFVLWGYEQEVEQQGALLESLGQLFVARGYYDDKHPNWAQVDFDHRGMMFQTVDRLLELGHDRIALLTHGNDLRYTANYRKAFDAVIHDRFHRQTPPEWVLLSNETVESGAKIIQSIVHWFDLPADRRPTALACANVESVMAAIDPVLLSLGVRIGDGPNQFAIAGAFTRTMTGPSWVYDYSAEADMIGQMIEQLLIPLFANERPPQCVLRYLPALRRSAPEYDIWGSGAITIKPRYAVK